MVVNDLIGRHNLNFDNKTSTAMNININVYPTNGVYSLRLFKSREEVGLPSGGGFSPDPDLPIYRRIRDRTFQWQKEACTLFFFI